MKGLEFALLAYVLMSVGGGASLVYYWGLPVIKETYPKFAKCYRRHFKRYMHIYLSIYCAVHVILVALFIKYLMNL